MGRQADNVGAPGEPFIIRYMLSTSFPFYPPHQAQYKKVIKVVVAGLEPSGRGLQRWGLHALDKPLGSDESPECSWNQGNQLTFSSSNFNIHL